MREILFRGKRKDNGEWVYGYYCKYGYTGKEKHYIIPSYASDLYAIEVIPETIGQFIGLTDKNGKKIFEGDIIQTKTTGLKGEKKYKFVIKYGKYIPLEYCRETYSQWQTIGFYAFDGKRDYQLSCFKELLEVIGNIHDNPDLLKGGEPICDYTKTDWNDCCKCSAKDHCDKYNERSEIIGDLLGEVIGEIKNEGR